MTTFNPRDISKFPGKLCVNPTDLSTPFPHGDTSLGVVRNIEFDPGFRYEDVTAEEFGGEVVESIATYQGCILAATLQSFDGEALRNIFWNTEEGTVSGRRGVREFATATNRAGFQLSGRSAVLCFSPNDVDKAPMLLIRRALPRGFAATERCSRRRPGSGRRRFELYLHAPAARRRRKRRTALRRRIHGRDAWHQGRHQYRASFRARQRPLE